MAVKNISKNKAKEENDTKELTSLAERVVWKRKAMGLQAVDLAKIINITPTSLNHVEMGNVQQPRYMKALADALDTSIEWLINGSEEPHVVRISEHVSIVSVDTPIKPDSNFDYYVVKIERDKKPFYADNMEQVGKINKIFIGHKN